MPEKPFVAFTQACVSCGSVKDPVGECADCYDTGLNLQSLEAEGVVRLVRTEVQDALMEFSRRLAQLFPDMAATLRGETLVRSSRNAILNRLETRFPTYTEILVNDAVARMDAAKEGE